MNFIDESPLASPRKSPMHSSSISLLPEAFLPQASVRSNFPLTDFEREPQVLRRFSAQGKGCSLTVPRPLRAQEDPRCLFPEGNRDPCRGQTPFERGEAQALDSRPASSSCSESGGFRTSLSISWGEQENLQKGGSKGSTTSFLSSPSASSGYITFHSDSIGSAS